MATGLLINVLSISVITIRSARSSFFAGDFPERFEGAPLHEPLDVPQVRLHVAGPGVVPLHAPQAVAGHADPLFPVAERLQDRLAQRLLVQGIDQAAVVAMIEDVDGAAIVRGDHGQAAGAGFDQGQSERFGERGIDEDALGARRDPVEAGDIVRLVLLGYAACPYKSYLSIKCRIFRITWRGPGSISR